MFKSEAKEKGFGFGLCFSKLSEKLSKSSSVVFPQKVLKICQFSQNFLYICHIASENFKQ